MGRTSRPKRYARQARAGSKSMREEGELPVHLEEGDSDADEQQEHGGDLGEAAADEGADGLDIGGGAGHQLAGLGLVVEAEGEPLDVGVE